VKRVEGSSRQIRRVNFKARDQRSLLREAVDTMRTPTGTRGTVPNGGGVSNDSAGGRRANRVHEAQRHRCKGNDPFPSRMSWARPRGRRREARGRCQGGNTRVAGRAQRVSRTGSPVRGARGEGVVPGSPGAMSSPSRDVPAGSPAGAPANGIARRRVRRRAMSLTELQVNAG
jgi:hypothetical protein